MMRLPLVLPGVSILAATLICALPWGGSRELQLLLPLMPYVLIHRSVECWGEAIPDWLVFLAGFALDVIGQGPLGYWALIYLSGFTMVRSVTADRSLGALARIVLFALTIACLALMQWSVTSIYHLRPFDFAPLAVAAAIASAAYVVLALLLPVSAADQARANSRLERGI